MSVPICVYSSWCDGGGCEWWQRNSGSVLAGGFVERLLARWLSSLCSRRRLSQLGKKSRAQGRFALQATAELLLPSPAGSPALSAPRNPELEAENKAGTGCPRLMRGSRQSTAPVAPLESGGARLGSSPAAMRYVIRMSVGERRRRLVMDIIRIVIRP